MVLLDPKTQAWLKNSLEPTFGFPKVARFSWTTVKILLEKTAHAVKWSDMGVLLKILSNINQTGLTKAKHR
jgi:ribonuclease H2 subunit A